MKVLMVNGSPHQFGTTYMALKEIQDEFTKENVESEIIWLGVQPIAGCIGCGYCHKNGKCFRDDIVNEFNERAKEADAFIFGSPVHYAAISGAMTSFMDRVFYSNQGTMKYKPCGCVVAARRAGTSAAFEQLLKYPTISEMPVISSSYWNNVFGAKAEEASQDEEGMYTMRKLARNMVYFLKCIEAGKEKGVALPEQESRKTTNFIR